MQPFTEQALTQQSSCSYSSMPLAGLATKRILFVSPCWHGDIYSQITKPMLGCISIIGRKKSSLAALLQIEALSCCILYHIAYIHIPA